MTRRRACTRADAAGLPSRRARDERPSLGCRRAERRAPAAPPAWQAAPFALVFLVFFLVPLALTVMVSFWEFNEYELIPAFTLAELRRRLRRLPGQAAATCA